MRTFNYKTAGWWVLRDILANGDEFRNSTKSFRGELGKPVHSGMLSPEWQDKLNADRPHITYAVYSYSTPIAWQLDGKAWVLVTDKFSQTTTQHQNKVAVAVSQL